MNVNIEYWNNWKIVQIDGAFVVRVISEIRRVFEDIDDGPNPCVALNLTDTSYIDSSAITLLLNFWKRLSSANGKLVVFGMSEDIQGIFSIVNMENYITIYTTREEFESACQEG